MTVIDLTSCIKLLQRRIHKNQSCIQNQVGIGACHVSIYNIKIRVKRKQDTNLFFKILNKIRFN
jgi:hypothetical protein